MAEQTGIIQGIGTPPISDSCARRESSRERGWAAANLSSYRRVRPASLARSIMGHHDSQATGAAGLAADGRTG